MEVRPLDGFAELCFHGLAHVPLADAGSSFAPDYLAWASGAGLGDDLGRIDGERIAATIGPGARGVLHRWPGLHRTLASFERTRMRELAELTATDVDDPSVLAASRDAGDPALELLHAMLSLAYPAWVRVHAESIAPSLVSACSRTAPLFAIACELAPSLQTQRVELSWVLGPRGRAHPDRIIVGAPAPWHDGEPARSVVLAMHEHAVRDLADGDWTTVEWSALRRVAGWMRGADRELAQAHRRWVAGLAITELTRELSHRGVIDARTAARLDDAPDDRAACLADAE